MSLIGRHVRELCDEGFTVCSGPVVRMTCRDFHIDVIPLGCAVVTLLMDDYENPSSSHCPDLPEIHKVLSIQISTLLWHRQNLRAGWAKFAIQSRT